MIIEIGVAAVVGVGIFVFGVLFGRANPKKTAAAIAEYKQFEQKVEDFYKKVVEEIKTKIK